MGVGGQRCAPFALHSAETRYPLYRRLCGLQGRLGRKAENLAPHRDATPGPSCPPCYPSQPLVSKPEGIKITWTSLAWMDRRIMKMDIGGGLYGVEWVELA